jgi:hypothetical protein
MSFLAPVFLLGAAAIVFPVLFHFIRRSTRDRIPFGSLMFLRPTPPRFTRRSRIEHWLLLALRCTALGLVALGFARPFLPNRAADPPQTAEARRTLLLLDVSASMHRRDLWAQALRTATEELEGAGLADEVAIVAFANQVQSLLSFEDWRSVPPAGRLALARTRLAEAAPGWSGTHLGAALIAAAEQLAEPGPEPAPSRRRIVLISDIQEGGRVAALQGYTWPRGVDLAVRPVKPRPSANASLQLVAESDSVATAASAVRVRVANAPDSTRDQFQVGWTDPAGTDLIPPVQSVYVPPGQSRIVALPAPATNSTRIELRGDDEKFDNTAFVLMPEPAHCTVLYLGTDPAADRTQPLFFLTRALRETRRLTVAVLARSPDAPVPAAELDAANLVFVADPLPLELAGRLRDRMLAGATVVVVPKTAAVGPTLGRLLDTGSASLGELRPDRDYALLGEIDFRHPLFAVFADPRFSDFSKLHVWFYRRLDPGTVPNARVIARFDSGDAAVLDTPAGRGRLLFLATSWHPRDSQLALSSKFVPLLYALLELSGAASLQAQPLGIAGEPIRLDTLSATTNFAATAHLPDGRTLDLPPGTTQFAEANRPGVYTFATPQATLRRAVNIDPAESRLTPLPIESLESMGAPVQFAAAPTPPSARERAAQRAAETEGRQRLWRLFLLATLAVLLVESALAGWTARAGGLTHQTI